MLVIDICVRDSSEGVPLGEPAISALRGRRPKPLDERAGFYLKLKMNNEQLFDPDQELLIVHYSLLSR